MSTPALPHCSRSLQILKTVLYILAGLVLLLGLIAGLGLIANASRLVMNALLPLQLLGGGSFYNLLAPMLSTFLFNLGVVTLLVNLVLSALLYAVGRLIGRIAGLEARLARLEASKGS